MYRKRAGLTQGELAFLLGWSDGSTVSRHEKRKCVPPLHIALAYEAALKVPVSELFAGILESIQHQTDERSRLLTTRLGQCTSTCRRSMRVAKKLQWLCECHGGSTAAKTS